MQNLAAQNELEKARLELEDKDLLASNLAASLREKTASQASAKEDIFRLQQVRQFARLFAPSLSFHVMSHHFSAPNLQWQVAER